MSTAAAARVLIAEDDAIIRLDLRSLLESSGLEVCGEARDGVEAVELAESLRPDVIVMDVRMPRLDGIDAASRILEARSVPIVMLTGFGQEGLVERAVEAGVFGFLAKPFHEDDLVSALRTATARHAEFTELKLQTMSLFEALEARKVIERGEGDPDGEGGDLGGRGVRPLAQGEPELGKADEIIAEAVAATLG